VPLSCGYRVFALAVALQSVLPVWPQQKPAIAISPVILTARTAYFDNQTGDHAVGSEAKSQLIKWARFQIVDDPKRADIILMLSADPRKAGAIIYSGGETGNVDKNGNINEDAVPTFGKQAPVRYAYLTVFDGHTGQKLWERDHQWGGILTGRHSVGARLISALRKQMRG
jgi:hypothetical protein